MRSRRLEFGIRKELLLFQLSYWVICFEVGEEGDSFLLGR